jgi:hypothetical protein
MTPERVWDVSDLLSQPDENALGASDVAEPIHVFVADHFVDELCAALAEPGRVNGDEAHKPNAVDESRSRTRAVGAAMHVVPSLSALRLSTQVGRRPSPNGHIEPVSDRAE